MAQRSDRLITLAIAGTLALFWTTVMFDTFANSVAYDFRSTYTGAKMAMDGRWDALHDVSIQFEYQKQFAQATEVQPFPRPAFYALLVSPLALFDYPTAMLVWRLGLLAAYIAFAFWASKVVSRDALVLCALFLPAILGTAFGQDGVWMLLCLAGSFELLRRDKPLASGAVLALGLQKFHLMALFPILLLATARRRRVLAGLSAVAVIEALVSFLLVGTHGIHQYLALLFDGRINPTVEKWGTIAINMQGLLANFGSDSKPAAAVLGLLAVAAAIYAGWRGPDWRMYAAASTGAVLALPHTFGYDGAYLLPGLLMAAFHAQHLSTRVVATLLCTPLPWGLALAPDPWSAAPPFLLILFLATLVRERALPLRLPGDEQAVGRHVLPVGDQLARDFRAVPPQ